MSSTLRVVNDPRVLVLVRTPEQQEGRTYTGGASNNVIYAYGGNDVLKGGGGDDFLNGGAGNDFLFGHGTRNVETATEVDTAGFLGDVRDFQFRKGTVTVKHSDDPSPVRHDSLLMVHHGKYNNHFETFNEGRDFLVDIEQVQFGTHQNRVVIKTENIHYVERSSGTDSPGSTESPGDNIVTGNTSERNVFHGHLDGKTLVGGNSEDIFQFSGGTAANPIEATIRDFNPEHDRIALVDEVGSLSLVEFGGKTVLSNATETFNLTIEGTDLGLVAGTHYYVIGANENPTLSGGAETKQDVTFDPDTGVVVDFNDWITDPDGDAMSFHMLARDSEHISEPYPVGLRIWKVGPTGEINLGQMNYGDEVTVDVTAYDGRGGVGTWRFEIIADRKLVVIDDDAVSGNSGNSAFGGVGKELFEIATGDAVAIDTSDGDDTVEISKPQKKANVEIQNFEVKDELIIYGKREGLKVEYDGTGARVLTGDKNVIVDIIGVDDSSINVVYHGNNGDDYFVLGIGSS